MTASSNDNPRIIIDEDWKSQVERERGEAAAQGADETAADVESGDDELPEASLAFLVTSFVSQTLAALGELPNPSTGSYITQLPLAKFHIDLIALLQEKTTGNVSSEEAELLEQSIHQLRMLYVARRHESGISERVVPK